MTETVTGREQDLALQDAMLQATWQQEDDALRMERSRRALDAKDHAEMDSFAHLQDELEKRMHSLEMTRQAKILEIERARAMRLAKEQADEAADAAERVRQAARQQAMAVASQSVADMAEKNLHEARERLLQSVDSIKEQSQQLVEAERQAKVCLRMILLYFLILPPDLMRYICEPS